jgi:hypothetical protein
VAVPCLWCCLLPAPSYLLPPLLSCCPALLAPSLAASCKQVLYLVHWKGTSSGEDTWEEAAALGQDEWLVSEWEHDQLSAAQQPAPHQTAPSALPPAQHDKQDKHDMQGKEDTHDTHHTHGKPEGRESVPSDNEEWHVQGHDW